MKNSSTAISCCSFIAATFPIFNFIRLYPGVYTSVVVMAMAMAMAMANGCADYHSTMYARPKVVCGETCLDVEVQPPFGCWITRRFCRIDYCELIDWRLFSVWMENGIQRSHRFWGKTFSFHRFFSLSIFSMYTAMSWRGRVCAVTRYVVCSGMSGIAQWNSTVSTANGNESIGFTRRIECVCVCAHLLCMHTVNSDRKYHRVDSIISRNIQDHSGSGGSSSSQSSFHDF